MEFFLPTKIEDSKYIEVLHKDLSLLKKRIESITNQLENNKGNFNEYRINLFEKYPIQESKQEFCTNHSSNDSNTSENLNIDNLDDILKNIYQKLVLKFHPDKNSDSLAGEIFIKIQKLYEDRDLYGLLELSRELLIDIGEILKEKDIIKLLEIEIYTAEKKLKSFKKRLDYVYYVKDRDLLELSENNMKINYISKIQSNIFDKKYEITNIVHKIKMLGYDLRNVKYMKDTTEELKLEIKKEIQNNINQLENDKIEKIKEYEVERISAQEKLGKLGLDEKFEPFVE